MTSARLHQPLPDMTPERIGISRGCGAVGRLTGASRRFQSTLQLQPASRDSHARGDHVPETSRYPRDTTRTASEKARKHNPRRVLPSIRGSSGITRSQPIQQCRTGQSVSSAIRRWQILGRERVVFALGFPEHGVDPPATSIRDQLNAVDPRISVDSVSMVA